MFRHFRINKLVLQNVHVVDAAPVAVGVTGQEPDGREEVERFCVAKILETVLERCQHLEKSVQKHPVNTTRGVFWPLLPQ